LRLRLEAGAARRCYADETTHVIIVRDHPGSDLYNEASLGDVNSFILAEAAGSAHL